MNETLAFDDLSVGMRVGVRYYARGGFQSGLTITRKTSRAVSVKGRGVVARFGRDLDRIREKGDAFRSYDTPRLVPHELARRHELEDALAKALSLPDSLNFAPSVSMAADRIARMRAWVDAAEAALQALNAHRSQSDGGSRIDVPGEVSAQHG